MARTRSPSRQTYLQSFLCLPKALFLSFSMILILHDPQVHAQDLNDPQATPSTSTDAFSPEIPLDLPTTEPSPASATPPPSTDSANYDTSHNTPAHPNVLNYYFLLLAVFVIVFALAYWILLRRRRKRLGRVSGRRQNALARDMERWPSVVNRSGRMREPGPEEGSDEHTRNHAGGWWHRRMHHSSEGNREEGLDENGEAPPAYVKEMEPVHVRGGGGDGAGGEAVEMRNMGGEESKPPDYQEHHGNVGR